MSGALDETDEAKFDAHFADYVQAVACKTIGDSGQYTKHLQRRVLEGDAAAVAQTTALNFFAGLQTRIDAAVQELRLLGQERIVRVCHAIYQEPTLPLARVQRWGLCALSGIPSNDVLQVGAGDSVLLLAPEFEAFATALWLVHNMPLLEKSRAAAFANTSPQNMTIAAIVTAYCQQQAAGSAGSVYAWAFAVVQSTLSTTRARLNGYLEELAHVQGTVSDPI